MEEDKLNRKLVMEKAYIPPKKKPNILGIIIFLLIVGGIVAFVVLEKMKYIDYLDFL